MEVINKKANFDYECLDSFTAGIMLYGSEVKSIRNRDFNLKDSFCYISNNELYSNFHISKYKESSVWNHEPNRAKKLLLNKSEIKKIVKNLKVKGITLIPFKIFTTDTGLIKVELWLAKGKKEFDKRNAIKEKDIKRDIDR